MAEPDFYQVCRKAPAVVIHMHWSYGEKDGETK